MDKTKSKIKSFENRSNRFQTKVKNFILYFRDFNTLLYILHESIESYIRITGTYYQFILD